MGAQGGVESNGGKGEMAEPEKILPLSEVARRLDSAEISWAVFAGAAATAYGGTRPLTDIDILVPAAEGDRLVALFPGTQVMRKDDGTVQGIQFAGFDILAGLNAMDLDDRMAARLTHHEIAGVVVPVIPPEDNILLKALRGRGPEVGKHDWEDVQEMMAHLPTLDWEYLRWRASKCAPPQRTEQLLERLETLWRQTAKTQN
jgi:hypothetical protein